MKQLEERLDPARFVRIHRSRIVNVERVRELRHLSHGDYEVTLANDVSLRVSRGRRKQLLDAVERAR
jgi:two-component system LytT family response regulator